MSNASLIPVAITFARLLPADWIHYERVIAAVRDPDVSVGIGLGPLRQAQRTVAECLGHPNRRCRLQRNSETLLEVGVFRDSPSLETEVADPDAATRVQARCRIRHR